MPDWLVWTLVAGVLAAAEVATLTFVLLMVAGGSVAAAVVAAAGAPLLAQFIVAIVVTLALLGGVRPIARRHLVATGPAISGTDKLIGTEAYVLRQVSARDGLVRLNGGEWTARTADEGHLLDVGSSVVVMRIDGATAVVAPRVVDGGWA